LTPIFILNLVEKYNCSIIVIQDLLETLSASLWLKLLKCVTEYYLDAIISSIRY
jgi:hypothetical protein